MKKFIATIGLMGILLVSTTMGKTGILVGDFQGADTPASCSEKRSKAGKSNSDWAIFITAFAGIFITAVTGVIYTDGFTRGDNSIKTNSNCRS